MDGAWEIPHPGAKVDAHCYSRALPVALFFQRIGRKLPDLPSVISSRPCCFICQLLFTCGHAHPAGFFQHSGKNQPQRTTGRNLHRQCCAAPSRRARGDSLNNPTTQDTTNPGREFVRTSKKNDAHCFSRALRVALFCTAFVLPRRLESDVRLTASTVMDLIG